MHRTPRIQALGRLAAVVAILIGLLLPLGAGPAAAEDFEPPGVLPSVPATGSLPGSIIVRWEHFEQGVHDYSVERESPYRRWDNVNAAQRDLLDGGLEPDTEYRYRVCAYFETEDGDVACSDWEPGKTSPPGQAPAANFDPPTITSLEATHDSITVTWGPTGDYTRILVHLSDDRGNVDQREVTNTPNGSFHFPGMRSGARYRVILKGCSLSLAGSGCGPWSPDVFITTPLPGQAAGGPPPGVASFESVNVPGHFIRHQNFELWLAKNDGSDLFAQDANWRQVPPR